MAHLLTIEVAQLLTIKNKNGPFLQFFALKNVLKYLFLLCFLNITQNVPKKGTQKKR